MILIDESQRDLLRIVWKDKIDSPVKIFLLTTVTYGTKSAPYLATRSLKQLFIDGGDKYPLAAEVIMSDVYMIFYWCRRFSIWKKTPSATSFNAKGCWNGTPQVVS
ncbi:uncharacterized protein TNCV_3241671 [Trichonephila clavipes]|nr:uncharacterized protein TNCV_3241671 [Trichonephila clavipes]